jgi:DNA-binding response OmpR family regulator
MNRSADSQAAPTNTSSGCLLIVEDDYDLRTAMSIGLRMEGYSVQGAGSVSEAQDFLQHEKVDLVMTDWYLPDGTGAQICMVARQTNPNMPIIALSGLDDGRTAALAGCRPNLFLDKPVNFTELFSHMRALLTSSG